MSLQRQPERYFIPEGMLSIDEIRRLLEQGKHDQDLVVTERVREAATDEEAAGIMGIYREYVKLSTMSRAATRALAPSLVTRRLQLQEDLGLPSTDHRLRSLLRDLSEQGLVRRIEPQPSGEQQKGRGLG